MDHEKKLAFIHKMTKMGLDSLPHYDDGGLTVGGPKKTGDFLGIGGTDLQAGTTAGQINQAYGQSQGALTQSGQLAGQLESQVPSAITAQQELSRQLQDQAMGKGPNPAQNQLAQATGRNINTQAALMAGERGAAVNPALIAREAAQQGAATQQQAAGEAATLGSQQQLAAQQNLTGLSATQVGQAGQAATAQNQATQNEQGQLLGANSNFNNASNTAIGQGNALGTNIAGGIAKGISGAAAALYKGGPVKMADGGSFVGQYLNAPAVESSAPVPQQTDLSNMAKGGEVNAEVSPDEVYLSPKKVQEVLKGADPMKIGYHVPGKAKVKDDSLKNDTVPADLEEGGVVIPRHITTHKMAPEKAAAFVHRVAAKKGLHR